MVVSEERLKILNMLSEGKISADEAARLLDAVEKSESKATPPVDVEGGKGGSRWFRVRVTDTKTGKARVNVRLPLGLVKAGIKLGRSFSPQMEGIDAEEIMQLIQSEASGQIVDVTDEDDGEHIEVFVE
jgi:hypothetical protein